MNDMNTTTAPNFSDDIDDIDEPTFADLVDDDEDDFEYIDDEGDYDDWDLSRDLVATARRNDWEVDADDDW